MPGLVAACVRALDKQDWPGGGDGAAHSLQNESLCPFHIDFSELRGGKVTALNQFIDGDSVNGKLSRGEGVTMPDQACRRRILRHTDHGIASMIRGCALDQTDVLDSVDCDIFSKRRDVLRNRLESDDPAAGADTLGERQGDVAHVGTNVTHRVARGNVLADRLLQVGLVRSQEITKLVYRGNVDAISGGEPAKDSAGFRFLPEN